MDNKDKISVIIPTYSRSDMLVRAIDSALNQSYTNIEVIVVDDNGADNNNRFYTESLMKKYTNDDRVQYIQHVINKGGSAARNTGARNAKGKYIALLDDDDEFLPNKLEMQINRISTLDETWCGSYCGCNIIMESTVVDTFLNFGEGDLTRELLLMDNPMFAGSTLLIKKDIFNKVGGFDESFIRHQDWEFLIRVFRDYKICFLNQVLANIHVDSNISHINSGEGLEKLKNKYLNTFIEDIHKFDKETISLIYRNHYFGISKIHMENKKILKSLKWRRIASKNHRLTKYQNTILIKRFIKCFISQKLLKKIKNWMS